MDAGTLSPGSAFAEALRAFNAETMAVDDLIKVIAREASGGVTASDLLDQLCQEQAKRPLPTAIFHLLKGRLQRLQSRSLVQIAADETTINLEEFSPRAAKDGAAAESSLAPPAIGVIANRYQLLELIGEGGSSRVFKAIDLHQASLGNAHYYVAVKVLLQSSISSSRLSMIESNFAKLKNLNHPSIARPLLWGTEGGVFFLSMEYVAGQSLRKRMQEGAVPRLEALDFMARVADALEAARHRSLIHGDLSPANILMSDRGEIKVIDFGWVPSSRTAATGDLDPAPVTVTPRYASPQRLQHLPPEPRDDVFALACITYELLTQHHPFETANSEKLVPPHRHPLSQAQYAALKRALDKDPTRRTASAHQFMRELWIPPRRTEWKWTLPVVAAILIALALGYWSYRQTAKNPLPAVAPGLQLNSPAVEATHVSPTPGSVIQDCAQCPSMRVIPAGRFLQGAEASDPASTTFEKPQRTVTIAYPLAMSTHTVTLGEFRAFLRATGQDPRGCEIYQASWRYSAQASWENPGFSQSEHHPVTCVSWNDATAYARWLSATTHHHYRLPSAAEWEYAARAGQAATVPWGSPAAACQAANVADKSASRQYPGWTVFACDDGYVNTAPVGAFAPNAFGLHDMLGNVLAWTQDCWTPSYQGVPADGSASVAADCSDHELRGASWFSTPAYVRTSYRNHFAADYRGSTVGIRLVRDLTP